MEQETSKRHKGKILIHLAKLKCKAFPGKKYHANWKQLNVYDIHRLILLFFCSFIQQYLNAYYESGLDLCDGDKSDEQDRWVYILK